MSIKPRTRRKIIWATAIAAAIAAIAIIVVPPMISLNALRPNLAAAITRQTGWPTQIRGNVHFSMLGGATIVARDVVIPNGTIDSVTFSIPMRDIFDIQNATVGDNVSIRGGRIDIERLEPVEYTHNISVSDMTVGFMGKDYRIVSGDVARRRFVGTVRTDDHKYDLEFIGDAFTVRNNNNDLEISGRLYPDGTARGTISIHTRDINAWFEFDSPKINVPVQLTMNFEWDGGYGFRFTDIRANEYTGDIILHDDGARDIRMRSSNSTADFSFLLSPTNMLRNTTLDLDLYGDMRFADRTLRHVACRVRGDDTGLDITSITADDIKITGGRIDADGAHDVMISMPVDGVTANCMFSGTPDNWKCSQFTYGPYSGSLSVTGTTFTVFIQSDAPMPTDAAIIEKIKKLRRTGRINFQFSDTAGTIEIDNAAIAPKYTFARAKTLRWLNPKMDFIPEFMYDAVGDFTWDANRVMTFAPRDATWHMTIAGDRFTITGKNAKDWLPDLDLRAVADLEYSVTGEYAANAISNMVIKIAGHEFTGRRAGDAITLHTDILNLDSFASQEFVDNYAELEFLTNAPIMIPFSVPCTVSLSAERLIYNGDEYKNFVYTLKPGVQTFSITDNDRGNMLATIEKDKNKYDISLQLGRFMINGALLANNMPLNIRDTTITAEMRMQTHGRIAHDIWYNMAGDMDMSFDGGYIYGIGTDDFYASAQNIGTLNAEFALSNALEAGKTMVKKLRVIGRYENDDFATTTPLQLSVRHADATGQMEIRDGEMSAQIQITLRGTAPTPSPITLDISPNGARSYSLTQIMRNFDSGFLREFVRTHDRF